MVKKNRSADRSASMSIPTSKSTGDFDRGVSFQVGGATPSSENGGSFNGLSSTPPSPAPPPSPTPSPRRKDEGPVFCGHTEHLGFHVLDEVYDLPVEKAFEVAFTFSDMYQGFANARKMFDLNVEDWPSEVDENGNKTRTLKYMLSLSYPVGPKSTICIEEQTLLAESNPGELYILDVYSITPDVPYGSSFGLLSRFCMTRVNSKQTRLQCNSQIKYRSKVMGFMKSIIEKSVTHGTLAGYGMFGEHIAAEAERFNAAGGVVMRKKKTKRNSKASSSPADTPTVPSAGPSIMSTNVSSTSTSFHSTPTAGTEGAGSGLAMFVFTCLVALLFLNVFLYYNLRDLETRAALINESRLTDWGSMLKSQGAYHNEEMKRWKDILWTSSQVLGQMKGQIDELQNTLDQRAIFEHHDPHS